MSQANETSRIMSTCEGRADTVCPWLYSEGWAQVWTWRTCRHSSHLPPSYGCYGRSFQSLHLKQLPYACPFQTLLIAAPVTVQLEFSTQPWSSRQLGGWHHSRAHFIAKDNEIPSALALTYQPGLGTHTFFLHPPLWDTCLPQGRPQKVWPQDGQLCQDGQVCHGAHPELESFAGST